MSADISRIVKANESNILTLIAHRRRKDRIRFTTSRYYMVNMTNKQDFIVVNNNYTRHDFKSITTYLREVYTYLNVKGYL